MLDTEKPVGTLRKLVSLVDRGAFDNIVYPQDENSTVFQPVFGTYHNFTTDIVVWPYSGAAEWGKRLTFTVPQPWQTDMLSWVALRLRPYTWLRQDVWRHLYETQDWSYVNPQNEWIWTKALGSAAIAKAELEVDGVTVEQWSGDWIHVWSQMSLDCNKGVGWDDSVLGSLGGTEDGSVYCFLPFWFARWTNVSFPLVSTTRPVRIHITLRPFADVVRFLGANKTSCDQSPLGETFRVADLTLPFGGPRAQLPVTVGNAVPVMEEAELVCGTALIDGDLRKQYRDSPHEILMNPVVEMDFGEPLKYTVGVPNGDVITIGLPLTAANGPLRQIVWFVRRKAVARKADWTNYSAILDGEYSADFNPYRPLLRRAQLQVGTAIWADEEESWWRSTGALPLAGGIRASGNYVYVYNFAQRPNSFDPTGSVNASRVDIRLNLEVEQPVGPDNEWEVKVFLVGTNWMRFQEGLAAPVFAD